MVERALAPLLADATAAEIRALRVCDPAMGDGAFLVEVIDVLAARLPGARATARRTIAERCVYGVDLDDAAVAAARARIAASTGADATTLARSLRVGDALAGFAWRDDFAEV